MRPPCLLAVACLLTIAGPTASLGWSTGNASTATMVLIAGATTKVCREVYPDLRSALDEAYELWRGQNAETLRSIETQPDYPRTLDKSIADEKAAGRKPDRAVCELMASAFYNNAWPLSDVDSARVGTEVGVVGLELNKNQEDEFWRVTRAIPGFDAHRHGMQPDDRVIAVNGVSMKRRELPAVTGRLRGPVGTTVAVTVSRAGMETPITFQLRRAAWK
jgi:C-terminal processing protease CtpA/Prc